MLEDTLRLRHSGVSVIVACYNHGRYLDQAITSVLKQTYENFEILVVDDGSTDKETIRILEEYQRPKTRLIRTVHQGLANARNTGIRVCEAKYILPLDADDTIDRSYLEKAVRVMEANDNVGITYCKAELFGEQSGSWNLPKYQFPEILYGNVIFCTALFRRSDWEEVKGYNPNMEHGWEDYDLWLSLIELGRQVYCIPETLFCYRRRSDSMISGITPEQVERSFSQLFRNHPKLYGDNMGTLLMSLDHLKHLAACQQERILALETRAQTLQTLIQDLESSVSWRITKPLRSAKALFCRR